MDWDEYEGWGRKISQWGSIYHKSVRDLPVRSQVTPGDVYRAIGTCAPERAEPMDEIMDDFEKIILPGMTHWQHPRFFAYFPSNATPPAILADFLTSTMAANCILWQTSPAGTELETRMMEWLRESVGLPDIFSGVIQDSASAATLAAVLTMRERALNWIGNTKGLTGQKRLRVYVSSESHSSIDKAIWISGIGAENIVRLPVSGTLRSSDASALKSAIEKDLKSGFIPAGVIGVTGATGMGACDDLESLIMVAKTFDLFVHIDAAWAGSAMICEEFRELWKGIERADSIVFNPHKWLGVQFDLSAHFVKNPSDLVRTLAIKPDYLKTHGRDGVINYSEWSIPLGRRFRALKLWFLLRCYGLEELRNRIRNHVLWSRELSEKIRHTPDFEISSEPILSLFTFRYVPKYMSDFDSLNQLLINLINDDGRIYLTQTMLDGNFVIRFQTGQFDTTREDVETAYWVIRELAAHVDGKRFP